MAGVFGVFPYFTVVMSMACLPGVVLPGDLVAVLLLGKRRLAGGGGRDPLAETLQRHCLCRDGQK